MEDAPPTTRRSLRQRGGSSAPESAQTADVTQAAETGEAQRATVSAATAEADLRAHAAELAAVAKLALADKPQLREKLGLLERS